MSVAMAVCLSSKSLAGVVSPGPFWWMMSQMKLS